MSNLTLTFIRIKNPFIVDKITGKLVDEMVFFLPHADHLENIISQGSETGVSHTFIIQALCLPRSLIVSLQDVAVELSAQSAFETIQSC